MSETRTIVGNDRPTPKDSLTPSSASQSSSPGRGSATCTMKHRDKSSSHTNESQHNHSVFRRFGSAHHPRHHEVDCRHDPDSQAVSAHSTGQFTAPDGSASDMKSTSVRPIRANISPLQPLDYVQSYPSAFLNPGPWPAAPQ
ncbi:hypothetical protein E1301_Tti009361 [Triplophysa tibetana]|uniref:Uncharacterized protein n=1 Tax=Triplophysa tibetana TaxID=1572043 RepID=A0A5A9P1N1_9TELE|nr:hypothetical protein E1301_Tti009361 [Triplophysa tibetana]